MSDPRQMEMFPLKDLTPNEKWRKSASQEVFDRYDFKEVRMVPSDDFFNFSLGTLLFPLTATEYPDSDYDVNLNTGSPHGT